MDRIARRALIAVAVFALSAALHAVRGHAARSPDRPEITPAVRAAGLSFDPAMAPADRAWVLAAIRSARPEAQRLVDEVDGMVTVGPMPPQGAAIGLMMPLSPGHYQVLLDVANLDGYERLDRPTVVLHELGHVIDYALLDDKLRAQLVAGIPRTGSCGSLPEPRGDCAAPRERFADTFAKWALRGDVSIVGAGYGVATPASLEDWGAPLAALAASLPPR
ncbi:MAG TPA: hypothetical protein VH418_01460 [Solirubrobacteraceae bacterium]|jgi:hypothetical protein